MRKTIINENWELEEVLDLEDLCAVLYKYGSNEAGYVEAFDFDDCKMKDAYDNLVNQYQEANADNLVHIYLVKLPNTNQVISLLNSALYNGNERVPEAIEAVNALCDRADCETLCSWNGCLTEDKKKKKVCSSSYCGFTDPVLNIKHFNQCMGTGGLQNPHSQHLIVGDVLPNAPVADAGSSDRASDAGSSAGEGGAMGESLIKENYIIRLPNEDGKLHDEVFNSKKAAHDYLDDLYINYHDEKFAEENLYPLLCQIKDDEWEEDGNGNFIVESLKNKLTEDKDFEIKIQDNENIEEDNEELNPPIDLDYFPNNMGINLSSVKSEKWTEQDDGQLKKVEIEFDPATQEEIEAQGGLNNGEEEKPIEESLTEAHLDYSTQLAKMKALEAGTRGFNAGSASLEKILYNYNICINNNLPKARKAMEDALRLHGWDNYIKTAKKQIKLADYTYLFKNFQKYFNHAAASQVFYGKDDPDTLLDDYGHSIEDLLTILFFALVLKQATLADKIKDYILANFTVALDELKVFLKDGFNQPLVLAHLNQTVRDFRESLDEAAIYSHKLQKTFDIPDKIKILPQNQVEDFIKQLAPEETFKIGYVTPLRFYKELEDKFNLVKATELEGYTGMDYRDAAVDAEDHDERVANAQRQIDTYTDGAEGHKLNAEGEKFSTSYRATNKLALNPKKTNQYVEYEYELDDQGNPKLDRKGEPIIKKTADEKAVIKSVTDMNKILFYPTVNSKPTVHYYIDFFDGKGFRSFSREMLVQILYKKIAEMRFGIHAAVSDADLEWLIKQGFQSLEQFYKYNHNIPVPIYKKAKILGVDPMEYWKEHPFSTRWSMDDFLKKADIMFSSDDPVVKTMVSDAETVNDKELDSRTGMSPHTSQAPGTNHEYLDKAEEKPQVRALYSNQVYYISGKPGTFGSQLTEGLKEDFKDFLDNLEDDTNVYTVDGINYSAEDLWAEIVTSVDSYRFDMDDPNENIEISQKEADEVAYEAFKTLTDQNCKKPIYEVVSDLLGLNESLKEDVKLDEAKRYVKRYYVRPQNIFCSNKEDILKALLRVDGENCSVYSLKNLADHDDVQELQPSDIIYYYDDGILYDKNHVKVMDYDLNVKHEEERKKFANVDTAPESQVNDVYDDRLTDADLKDKEAVANFRAINQRQMK